MGLDISVVKLTENSNGDVKIGKYEYFVYQLGNLKMNKTYNIDILFTFIVGSYSYYNGFRENLFHSIYGKDNNIKDFWKKYEKITKEPYNKIIRKNKLNRILDKEEKITYNEPFFELIHFSDCKGIIDSEIVKKLYKDFIKYENKHKQFNYNLNNDYVSLYKDLKDATSHGNPILFH